jgi:hypothetical protein
VTAIVQAIFRNRTLTTENETDALTLVALFCCAGLFVSLMYATYGIDLSPGFF